MRDFSSFQRAFGRALIAPPGTHDESALPGLALTVHRNTVFKGLVDALVANYPTVCQLVGEEWFQGCAREYVRAHPARSSILALYGERFAEFLAGFTPAAELHYLCEVARIDRQWIESLTAFDTPALAPSAFAGLSSAALASQRVTLHPATRIAWVKHSAAAIWIHHRASSSQELAVEDTEEGILLTRRGATIEHLLLGAADFRFLECLRDGMLLGDAAAAALQVDATADIATILAQSMAFGAFGNLTENLS